MAAKSLGRGRGEGGKLRFETKTVTGRGKKRTKIRGATMTVYLTPQDLGEENDRGFRLMSRRTLWKKKMGGRASYGPKTRYYAGGKEEEEF